MSATEIIATNLHRSGFFRGDVVCGPATGLPGPTVPIHSDLMLFLPFDRVRLVLRRPVRHGSFRMSLTGEPSRVTIRTHDFAARLHPLRAAGTVADKFSRFRKGGAPVSRGPKGLSKLGRWKNRFGRVVVEKGRSSDEKCRTKLRAQPPGSGTEFSRFVSNRHGRIRPHLRRSHGMHSSC